MDHPLPPPEEKLFSALQRDIKDIGVYTWNISGGLSAFIDLHDALKKRQLSLAPFIVQAQGKQIPATPLDNPRTRMSSFCFIRMVDDEDPRYRVDCLMRDSDWYFSGFRRELTLSEAEVQLEEQKRKEREAEASSSKGKKRKNVQKERKQGWGTVFRFNGRGMEVPEFLNAEMLNISGSYKDQESTRPGGLGAVRSIFRAFSRHEDKPLSDDDLAIQCYCFMAMVSEPTRLLSMLIEGGRRMGGIDEFGSAVTELLWKKMHHWGQMSNLVQEQRLLNRLGSHHWLKEEWCSGLNLVVMRELIGQRGELLLIKTNPDMLGIPEDMLEEMKELARKAPNNGPADRRDPWL